jgi:hypothetical protein
MRYILLNFGSRRAWDGAATSAKFLVFSGIAMRGSLECPLVSTLFELESNDYIVGPFPDLSHRELLRAQVGPLIPRFAPPVSPLNSLHA